MDCNYCDKHIRFFISHHPPHPPQVLVFPKERMMNLVFTRSSELYIVLTQVLLHYVKNAAKLDVYGSISFLGTRGL
jgi:hypothetical protein